MWGVHDKVGTANRGPTMRAPRDTFPCSFATRLSEGGYDIRTVQQLLGHKGAERTTKVSHHAAFTGLMAVAASGCCTATLQAKGVIEKPYNHC